MDQISPIEIGICVEDMDVMMNFYRDVLGFDYISTFDVPADKSGPAGFSNNGYQIVRLQLPLGERIKLVKPVGDRPKRSQDDEVLGRQGNVFFTYIVADLDALVERMRTAGAKVMTSDARLEVRDGIYLCNMTDPEGNFIEVVEIKDISAYRPEIQAGKP